jgi:Glycosyl transferases group 1
MNTRLQGLIKLGHQLDGTLNRYRSIFYAQGYLDYYRWLKQQKREIPINKPIVVFDFRDTRIDGPQGRRFYCLFIFFVRAGYYPVLQANYRFLTNIETKHKKYCLLEDFSVLKSDEDITQDYLLVTDKWFSSLSDKATKIITIDYRPDYNATTDACFPLPFPMFSPIYALKQDLQLEKYRSQIRKWSVFFGGDAQPTKYNKDSILTIYKKLSRSQILNHIAKYLPTHQYLELKSTQELSLAPVLFKKITVVMNTRECKVEPENWLSTLSNCQFFLACPGVRYPMSHNLIEAMAVGSIPITQYPEMFFPALENGKNCLVFNNRKELLDQVLYAMTMPESDIKAMAEAAITYYDNYLKPTKTINALLSKPERKISLRLLPFLKDGGGFA